MAKKPKITDDLPKAKLTRSSLRRAMRVFNYMGRQKFKFLLGMVFLVLTGITALLFPMLMGSMFNSIGTEFPNRMNGQNEKLLDALGQFTANEIAIMLLVLFVLQAIFSFFRIFLFVEVTEKTLANLREATYRQLIMMPMTFFSQRRVGELNSRISADIAQLQDTFTTAIAEFLRQLIIITGGIVLIVYTSAELSAIMLAVIPVVMIAAVFFGRFIRKLSRKAQDEVAHSNTIVEETLQGIANVKAFANELFEITRYRTAVDSILKTTIKGGRWRGAFASFVILCIFGSIVFIVWYAIEMVNEGRLEMAELITFVLYTIFVGASTGGITEMYSQIQKAIGSTERLMDIIDSETENLDITADKAAIAHPISGNIEFKDVTFSYPTRTETTVLHSVGFSVSKGKKLAIVGPSGAGKTTIVSLLLRFYDINSGEILIDQKSIYDYSLSELRNQMALVPQDVFLFGGTIRENIAYGNPDAGEQEIIDAAEKANAKEFIERFPEKYDTIVGERGVKLSGGQRQRIAIARAVLKNPSILILDEATSSLDSESERLVQEALNKLMEGRTSIIIAHRLSTVKNADKIIVLDHGRLVESGSHEELIANEEGLYHSLSRLQFEVG